MEFQDRLAEFGEKHKGLEGTQIKAIANLIEQAVERGWAIEDAFMIAEKVAEMDDVYIPLNPSDFEVIAVRLSEKEFNMALGGKTMPVVILVSITLDTRHSAVEMGVTITYDTMTVAYGRRVLRIRE